MSCRGSVRSDSLGSSHLPAGCTGARPAVAEPTPTRYPYLLWSPLPSRDSLSPPNPLATPSPGGAAPLVSDFCPQGQSGGGQASPRLRSQQVHPLAAAPVQGIILDSSVPLTPRINPLEGFIRLQNYSKCTQFSLSSPLTPQPWPRSSPTCATSSALRLESCPLSPLRTLSRVVTVLVFSY